MWNFISITNLIIAVQAFFLSIHFLAKRKGSKTLNKLVSIQTFVFGLIALNTYLLLIGESTDLFQEITNNTMWFIGPSIYLFVQCHYKEPNSSAFYEHFIPFILIAVFGISFYERSFSWVFPFTGFIQIMTYLILSLTQILQNFKKAQGFFAWIFPSLVILTVVVILNFTLSVLNVVGFFLLNDEQLLSFATLLGVPIFYMAYREMNAGVSFGVDEPKYKTSHLSSDKLDQCLEQIEQIMLEQKLYLDKGLTQSKLAEHIDLPQKYISQAINQRLGKTFNEYLLEKRMIQVEQDLINPTNQHMTIQGIAENAGFASLSRFNHHFKRYKGQTPGQFQRANRLK